MKILLTGGGSGGHFYPIIAVAQEINKQIKERKLLNAELFYMAPTPYNPSLLFENGITFKQVSAGKVRRYFSLLNFFDFFKTLFGVISATFKVFSIYPDVVFGKGGYVSFPPLFAARLLKIPIVIHESDTVPGRVNKWAGKFATKIAISYPETAEFFPKEKVAFTGNPIREELVMPLTSGAHEFLQLEKNIPVILILGGSQGSQIINETIIDALPKLVEKYQVIHQTGKNNFEQVVETANVVLGNSSYKERYRPFDYLNVLSMRMAAGAASVVISRAGSSIFEIAAWGVPSIIIPIADSNGDHQRKNAFAYARAGACKVVEESNLSDSIVIAECDRLIDNQSEREVMSASAKAFFKKDAGEKIAREIINIALSHEA